MTDDEIEAGLALCDGATEGPWTIGTGYGCYVVFPPTGATPLAIDIASLMDAEFIAAARTLLPRALKEIQRLRRNETDNPIVKLNRICDALNEPLECGHKLDEWCDVCGTCGACCEEGKVPNPLANARAMLADRDEEVRRLRGVLSEMAGAEAAGEPAWRKEARTQRDREICEFLERVRPTTGLVVNAAFRGAPVNPNHGS